MKSVALVGALMGGLMTVSSAQAVDIAKANQLAGANACMGCHAVDKKLVGPAYKDVAAKYKGDKDGVAKLVKKVKAGGSGVWGPIPMPAHPDMSDADAKTLVEWVLAGAPAK
nr:c-type cytochrome [Pandoraea terrae]